MEFKGNQSPLRVHRLLFVLAPLMILIISAFAFQNSRRIQIQNQIYTKEVAMSQAEALDELIDTCSESILMYADMAKSFYALTDISQYEKNSPFQSLFLVRKDGKSANGRAADLSQTDIILRGTQGKTGIMVDYDAVVSDEVTIVFYAPVIKNGSVSKIVVGTLAQAQLEKVMDVENFGYSSMTCLVSSDGDIISGSKAAQEWIGKNLFLDYHQNDTFLSTTLDELSRKHLTKESLKNVLYNEGSFGYCYKHDKIVENAYIAALNHSNFALMKVFPKQAAAAMENSMNHATIMLSAVLIFLFACYMICVVIDYKHKNTTLRKENETVYQILEAFYGIYDRFCVVDLTADTYEYFQFGELKHHGIEKKGAYTQLRKKLSGLVDAEKADGDIWTKYDSKTLKNVLSAQHPVMRQEVFMKIETGKWENITFIGLDYMDHMPEKMIFAVQDITAQHEKMVHMNQMLKEASQDAQAANEAKSEFLSRMSHDIRTPLNGILGMTAIAKYHQDDPAKVMDCLNKIDSSGEFLLGLVNEILDISKIESGKMMLDKEDANLDEMLTEVHDMIQVSTNKKNQRLVWNNFLTHPNVVCDKTRLKSIIINILSNAMKYTPENGRIEFTAFEEKKDTSAHMIFVFECRDNGIGMTKEFLDVIFEPFTRDENKAVQNEQGSGLGLCIVKSMARLMGGDITVSSKPNEGSVFRVYVPLKVTENALHNEAKDTVDSADIVKFHGARCLLVDDNELNREIATELLEITQIAVEVACNGAEAVELFNNHPAGYYQMIFMDIQMPVMNGYEAANAIRSSNKKDAASIPIIAMTANAYVEDVKAAIDAGMNDHLAKPINVQLLYRVMSKYLKGH